jgi:hypothetical protein
MYAARIQMGWVDKCFEGETATDIIREAEAYQDFGCLVRMGRMEEGEKGQKEIDKLEAFLDKYYDGSLTMEDIKGLNVKLGIGSIVCSGIADGEKEIEKLKAQK